MTSASAANTASIQFLLSDEGLMRTDEGAHATIGARRDRYAEFISHLSRPALLSGNRQETQMLVPRLAQWLDRVEQRIRNSIALDEQPPENERQWISPDVAQAALGFFRDTADVLPGEPFIYASRQGDLVAEFSGAHGTLTSIISPRIIILFAQVGEKPVEKRLDPRKDTPDALRHDLKLISSRLHTSTHGSLESSN